MPSGQLSPKQRVKTAFNHQEPDRVPIGELAISEHLASELLGREAWVVSGGTFSGKIANRMLMEGRRDELVERHCADTAELIEKLDLDLTFFPGVRFPKNPAIPVQIKENEWLVEDKANDMWFLYAYSPDSDTYSNIDCSIRQRGFSELEKYVKMLEHKLAEGPIAAGELDFCEYIVKRLGGDRFVIGNIQEGFPSDQSWLELYLEGLLEEPELIQRYMEVKTKIAVANIEAQAKIGVDAVYGGKDFAGTNGLMLSPNHFRQFILPYLQELSQACHNNRIRFVKHEDGNINIILREFLLESGIDAYHAIEPVAGMDIARIKEEYGDKVTLIGNIDCAGVLMDGTEEEIELTVAECIGGVSAGGGHILSSSNSIHAGVPLKNYLTMLRAARKYGVYKES